MKHYDVIWLNLKKDFHGFLHVARDTIKPKNALRKNKKSTRGSTKPSYKAFSKINGWRASGAFVSTVFLGIDHSWLGGPPILFETMIFGGQFDEVQKRYCTMEEAIDGHAKLMEHLYDIEDART